MARTPPQLAPERALRLAAGTRHVLGSPQASRGCTRAAAACAGFTARSLRYSGQCAPYAGVHTPSQH
eukprot:1641439-Prymnesium_polylepis.1